MPDDVLTRPQSTVPTGGSSQEAADARDLAGFGYKQELKRILGVYSSFAVAFSYISPSTGIFTLFAPIGLAIAGPFFFWSWPLVALGQFIIALNFAEVSSHFPVAGSVYQWTKYLSNRAYSWMTGWVYLFAGILTVTGVVATVPGLVLIPLLNNLGIGIENIPRNQIIIALLVLASTTLLNVFGVRLVALINNTGVVFEILGMVVFALILLIFFHHQPASVLFDAKYLGSNNQVGVFFAAMFMSLFVIYGFDTASTLAEETKNPRVEAPKAVLGSVVGAFIIGTIFLLALIIAIPNMQKFVAGAGAVPATITSPADVLNAVLPGWMANVYLLVVLAAIYVCCLAIQTSTIRLAFGMARDGKLPLARYYTKYGSQLPRPFKAFHIGPVWRAERAQKGRFREFYQCDIDIINRESLVVNLLGLAWGGSMLVNFLWPRPASNPSFNTILNPTGAAGGASLGGFGDSIPIFELVVVVIVVVGAVYYYVAQRSKTDQVVRAA